MRLLCVLKLELGIDGGPIARDRRRVLTLVLRSLLAQKANIAVPGSNQQLHSDHVNILWISHANHKQNTVQFICNNSYTGGFSGSPRALSKIS